jgi:hypothetical protein
VSAEISKRRVVRLDVKLVVSDCEIEDIRFGNKHETCSSERAEERHQWSTPGVHNCRKTGLVSLRLSRRGRRTVE